MDQGHQYQEGEVATQTFPTWGSQPFSFQPAQQFSPQSPFANPFGAQTQPFATQTQPLAAQTFVAQAPTQPTFGFDPATAAAMEQAAGGKRKRGGFEVDEGPVLTEPPMKSFADLNHQRKRTLPIPDEMVKELHLVGSILWSRGKPFNDALMTILHEYELGIWHQMSHEMDFRNMPTGLPDDIREKVETLKTERFFSFFLAYDALPPAVKMTFMQVSPNFDVDIREVAEGHKDIMSFGFLLISIWYHLISQ